MIWRNSLLHSTDTPFPEVMKYALDSLDSKEAHVTYTCRIWLITAMQNFATIMDPLFNEIANNSQSHTILSYIFDRLRIVLDMESQTFVQSLAKPVKCNDELENLLRNVKTIEINNYEDLLCTYIVLYKSKLSSTQARLFAIWSAKKRPWNKNMK